MGAMLGRCTAQPKHPVPSAVKCQRWELVRRPAGLVSLDDFVLRDETIKCDDLEDGEVVVQCEMLSVDAFLRTMLDEEAFHGGIKLGSTVPALGYGRVIASANPKLPCGMRVAGMLGAQDVARLKRQEAQALMAKPSLPYVKDSHSLGLLSLSCGLTAWMGIYAVAKPPRRGENVVVSGAAGATGSVAAQLAKVTGARVFGIAGGPQKSLYVTRTLGLAGAVDYKNKEKSVSEQIKQLCPDGVDFYFDTVGGETLDAVLSNIRQGARIVICGASSQYNGNLNVGTVHGPSEYLKLAERNASMIGFTVFAHMRRVPFALIHILWLLFRHKIFLTEQIEHGISSFAPAMVKMFTGGHIGKLLVQIADATPMSSAPLRSKVA
mmetsp:Transcript_11393/g.16185  ORF Transcript_11393/g.16185 Transcript_11393/m.16185 type:complete len:379 (-) Transcript_11393:218-1354(-)|eukprot:scaffold139070_cov30-Tisochrysis_lutea.AAC.2